MANTKQYRASSISIPQLKIADVPDAPNSPTATDVGTSRAYNNGSATVTYTAATTGGAATTFTATSTPGSFTATGASPVTVTGLQSATSYTFAISAANSSGTLTSASTSAITATTVPQAPTIGTAADGGTGTTATVAFTAGATGGKSITGYSVVSSPTTTTQSASSSPYTFTGLTAGTSYTFQVAAINANGTSSYSSTSNSVTPVVPSNFFKLATVTAAGGETSFSFSSIPGTYKSLQIRGLYKDTRTSTSVASLQITFNSDTGSNYAVHYILSNAGASTVNAGGGTAYNNLYASAGGISNVTNTYGASILDFVDYASTSKYKVMKSISGQDSNGAGTSSNNAFDSGVWLNTSAITTVTLTAQQVAFAAGSTFSLYGVS